MADPPFDADPSRSGVGTESVEQICRRFEAAWQSGGEPRIGEYLATLEPETPAAKRLALLVALVRRDLWWRWQRTERACAEPAPTADTGETTRPGGPGRGLPPRPLLEDYVASYPELGLLESLPEELALEERRVCEQFADLTPPPFVSRIAHPARPTTPLDQCESFQPSERFVVQGELGAGGMGVVYCVLDRQRNEVVALKTLRDLDASSVYRLKREFRALAGLVHPNLTPFYQLFCEQGNWFYTMELVDGVDFLSYVRPAGSAAPGQALSAGQLTRLRTVLRQLTEVVAFLHSAGNLHRDIKPNNVLVTAEGRVRLLDFGLVTELERAWPSETTGAALVGTLAYMAPEQAACQPLSAAADWYSVGVMLFETLTGQRPFQGTLLDVLQDKQLRDAPAPRDVAPGVPEDLNTLCCRLLSRDPNARPGASEMLAALAATDETLQAVGETLQAAVTTMPFVGRDEQLALLRTSFAALQQGHSTVVQVEGRSGVGKSALVRRFLGEISARSDTVVLSGRCYESESVPYKALDSLIDALSHYLLGLQALEADALLPRDTGALAQAFPLLCRCEAVSRACRRDTRSPDQQQWRQRAFLALRDLLARLGDRRTLVLSIDDLHWSDRDSVELLNELLRPPDPPRLMLLACSRNESLAANSVLANFLAPCRGAGEWDLRRMELPPLTLTESERLAQALVQREGGLDEPLAATIARESGGNPYFVEALVQYRQHNLPAVLAAEDTSLRLGNVLWARISCLPEPARRLVEVVAVAGRPLPLADAWRAAKLSQAGCDALGVARAAHLLRTGGDDPHDEVETYHDQIRDAVCAHLAPQAQTECQRRLAAAMEASGRADPAILAGHFHDAGDRDRAAHYYALAADEAAEALAFDRAADLYRLASELGTRSQADERTLLRKRADALANAGRGAEAARAYLKMVADAPGAESLELRRCAAMQYLVCGHVDEGLVVLRSVLAEVGIPFPRTSWGARWSGLAARARVWLRGLNFRRREAAQIAMEELGRVDICWSAGVGLGMVDPVRGAAFHARGLLLALQCGEPYRIGRALAVAAAHASFGGRPARRRVTRLADRVAALQRDVPHPHVTGMMALAEGIAAYCQGRWQQAVECFDCAEEIFHKHCTGVTWELDSAQGWAMFALHPMGQLAEIARRLSAIRAAAERRGDLYALSLLVTYVGTVVNLAADDPNRAERELRSLSSQWSQAGFHMQHYHFLYAQVFIDRYRGHGELAWKRLTEAWPALVRSQLLRIQPIRVMLHHVRAASALVAAESAPYPQRFLRDAEKCVRQLRRQPVAWAEGLWRLLRAGISVSRGNTAAAVPLLEKAIDDLTVWEWGLYAAAARRRLGELRGGDEGRSLVDEADCWMIAQGVVHPARMTAFCAPGFPPPRP